MRQGDRAMQTLADRVKILVDWWPLVVLLQQVAVTAPGRPQAEAFANCLRFLATKTEIDVDDRLVEHVQKLIATPQGGELIDYVVSLVNRRGGV
jgi:hypothetical protein